MTTSDRLKTTTPYDTKKIPLQMVCRMMTKQPVPRTKQSLSTDTNKGNGPTKNHAQLQISVTRDEELEDVQTLADNPSRQPFLGYGRASTTVDILEKLLTGPPLYHRRQQ